MRWFVVVLSLLLLSCISLIEEKKDVVVLDEECLICNDAEHPCLFLAYEDEYEECYVNSWCNEKGIWYDDIENIVCIEIPQTWEM